MPPMETKKISKSNSELKKLNRVFHLQSLNSANKNLSRIRIDSNHVYTIGRKRKHCDIIVDNRYVSKRHCQIFHNPFEHKLQLTDGCFLDKKLDPSEKVSLNGVFVNGKRVEKGSVVELHDKDEIMIGLNEKFTVEECEDEVFDKMSERKLLDNKAGSILDKCQNILNSTDPVSYLRTLEIDSSLVGVGLKQNEVDEVKLSRNDTADRSLGENAMIDIQHSGINVENGTVKDFILNGNLDTRVIGSKDSDINDVINKRNRVGRSMVVCNDDDLRQASCSYNLENKGVKITENGIEKRLAWSKNAVIEVIDLDDSDQYEDKNDKHEIILEENIRKDDNKTSKAINNFDLGEASENNHYSNGKYFFLNRLENMGLGKLEHEARTITLPELLHPVGSILRVFLATFTSDVAWFLSYCQLPYHLPITIACHCAEKCWSSSRENRTSAPFSYYPNLLLV